MIDELVAFGGLAYTIEEKHSAMHRGVDNINALEARLTAEDYLLAKIGDSQLCVDWFPKPEI